VNRRRVALIVALGGILVGGPIGYSILVGRSGHPLSLLIVFLLWVFLLPVGMFLWKKWSPPKETDWEDPHPRRGLLRDFGPFLLSAVAISALVVLEPSTPLAGKAYIPIVAGAWLALAMIPYHFLKWGWRGSLMFTAGWGLLLLTPTVLPGIVGTPSGWRALTLPFGAGGIMAMGWMGRGIGGAISRVPPKTPGPPPPSPRPPDWLRPGFRAVYTMEDGSRWDWEVLDRDGGSQLRYQMTFPTGFFEVPGAPGETAEEIQSRREYLRRVQGIHEEPVLYPLADGELAIHMESPRPRDARRFGSTAHFLREVTVTVAGREHRGFQYRILEDSDCECVTAGKRDPIWGGPGRCRSCSGLLRLSRRSCRACHGSGTCAECSGRGVLREETVETFDARTGLLLLREARVQGKETQRFRLESVSPGILSSWTFGR